MTYELHPLCTLFPRLTGAEFEALRDDIKANGLRQPIVLHEGLILDGGNRYRACLDAGFEPHFTEFNSGSIVAFVLSQNLHRRHMTPGQQAAIVSSAQDWAKAQKRGGDGSNQHKSKAATLPDSSPTLDTVADRALQSGASERTQRMADKVAKADPDLAKKVAHGEVSLPAAVKRVSSSAAPATAPNDQGPDLDDAHGDFDPLDELEKAQKEVNELTALIAAAEADDLKAEVIKWRRAYDHATREQGAAMERSAQSQKREAWTMRQLRRCGKAVEQDDPEKIAPAIEAFVRQHRKAAP